MNYQATRERLQAETTKLADLVSVAPAGHPAKIAVSTLAAYLPQADYDWLDLHSDVDAEWLCNEIAKGTKVPGIGGKW